MLVLELCRWDAAEFMEEAAVVEPVDPFEGGEFDIIEVGAIAGPIPDGLLECVQRQVGSQRSGRLPAHDPPAGHVGDERNVEKPGPRSDVSSACG